MIPDLYRFAFLTALFSLTFVTAGVSRAETPPAKAGHKSTSAAKKTTAKKTTGKAPARKTKTTKTTSSRSRSRRPVRRSSLATQRAPTKERYLQIEQALAEKGYLTGAPDGKWGEESVEALKKFQQDQNLEPSGKLDALSLIALGLGPKRQSSGARNTQP